MTDPLSPTPLPPFRGRGANEPGETEQSLSPSAGEGRPARSGGRERGKTNLLRSRAKQMRSHQTDAERRLWQMLRAKRLEGYKFKRQLVIDGYIADFVCVKRRLIVEADGGHHCENRHDEKRDAYLRGQGFRILRIWNNEIFENEEGVFLAILNALENSSPQPLSR